jgi:ribosomal protein S27AE
MVPCTPKCGRAGTMSRCGPGVPLALHSPRVRLVS